ncbi:MAG: hypothetical protein HOP29_17735 [Phycisphaerales bacterium]|nr:hypothetical protein [Phycisphaerales bacterium]
MTRRVLSLAGFVMAAAMMTMATVAKESSSEKCPRSGECPDYYAPVVCAGGGVYGNACLAFLACATDCVPWTDPGETM